MTSPLEKTFEHEKGVEPALVKMASLSIFFIFLISLIVYSWQPPELIPLGDLTDRTLGAPTGPPSTVPPD